MAVTPEYRIYISSTIDDLVAERQAAADIASKHGRLVDSYRLTEQEHAQKCIDDVRSADLYIGIVGRCYGWIVQDPPGDGTKSITELEFEACERPDGSVIPRLMLVRTVSDDKFDDLRSGRFQEPERTCRGKAVDAFRRRAAKTGIEFKDAAELRAKLVEAVIAARHEHFGGRGMLEQQRHFPSALAPLALLSLAGGDDDARRRLVAAQPEAFVDTPLRLDDAELLWQAEAGPPGVRPEVGLRRAQAGALLIGAQGLKLLDSEARVARVGRVLELLAQRCGRAIVIALDLAPSDLPAAWPAAEVLPLDGAALAAQLEVTVGLLLRGLRKAAALAQQTRLAVPLLLIAPDATEADALRHKPAAVLAAFGAGDERTVRGAQLKRVVEANRKADPAWPAGYYGATPEQWRCFGAATAPEIVAGVLQSINRATPGSRERRELDRAQLVLRPYRLDDFMHDVDGSRRVVRAACEAGALVLVDELALLHPALRAAARELLARERCAVATVSVGDPAHSTTTTLVGDLSYLKVGIVVDRFDQQRDLQCELHLNSAMRLERWLRGAIPRLVGDLAGHDPRPGLANRVDELLP